MPQNDIFLNEMSLFGDKIIYTVSIRKLTNVAEIKASGQLHLRLYRRHMVALPRMNC